VLDPGELCGYDSINLFHALAIETGVGFELTRRTL
jgi:hypothetical protein